VEAGSKRSARSRILGRMRIHAFAAVLLSALASMTLLAAQTETPRKGAPADRPVAIYAVGNESCAVWLDVYAHRDDRDARLVQFDAYLNGFATAYNIYGPDDLTARGNNVLTSPPLLQHASLETYCRDHPLDLYLDAVNQLLRDLRAKTGA
jgi:hypothetical protein